MKKFLFAFSTFFIMFFSAKTQDSIAPNFKVTDIFGFYYNLYSDLLAQGKFVFVDFFTNGCIYCQRYAPIVDSAYRQLGCGCGNVDFFAMNADEYSTNEDVLYFIDRFHITFNPVSAQGGSAYTAEIYGVYYTPYFILIAPDTTILLDDYYFHTSAELIDTLMSFGVVPTDCQKANIRYFELRNVWGDTLGIGQIDFENQVINVQIPDTADITNLIAFFIPSANSSVFIDTVEQISGKTINDFSEPVYYKVVAQVDTIFKFWQVNVSQFPTSAESYKDFYLYPNPAKNYIFVGNDFNGTLAWIYDLQGKIMKVKAVKNGKILITDLPSGIYILVLKKDGKYWNYKFVK